MARVLVVDDESIQRRAVGAQLEAAGFQVALASDGRTALASIRAEAPDVVVTDLKMPNMNGLELVEASTSENPLIPVILMTAYGSEEIAVTALLKGAANYVPKSKLDQDLIGTIHASLDVARAAREEADALDRLVATESIFEIDNDHTLIAPLVGHVQSQVKKLSRVDDESLLIQLGIAVQEALLNAMHHGNLELSSELRERGPEQYQQAIEGRRCKPPFSSRRVRMRTRIARHQLQVSIRDEGPGFDPDGIPDPLEPSNLERISGRGLYLIWTFMDEVSHNEQGNEIHMIKRFHEHASAATG